jgi:hypothetical protein
MANEKITKWMEKQESYGIFLPPMEAQKAVDFLCQYLLGNNWCSPNPVSTRQINTEIVIEILYKYSSSFRKEVRRWKMKSG